VTDSVMTDDTIIFKLLYVYWHLKCAIHQQMNDGTSSQMLTYRQTPLCTYVIRTVPLLSQTCSSYTNTISFSFSAFSRPIASAKFCCTGTIILTKAKHTK